MKRSFHVTESLEWIQSHPLSAITFNKKKERRKRKKKTTKQKQKNTCSQIGTCLFNFALLSIIPKQWILSSISVSSRLFLLFIYLFLFYFSICVCLWVLSFAALCCTKYSSPKRSTCVSILFLTTSVNLVLYHLSRHWSGPQFQNNFLSSAPTDRSKYILKTELKRRECEGRNRM